MAIDNSFLFASDPELTRLRFDTAALREFVRCLHQALRSLDGFPSDTEIMTLLADLLGSALESVKANDGSLLVVDEEAQDLVFIVTSGEVPTEKLQWRRLPLNEGIAGWVVEHRTAVIVRNPAQDPRFSDTMDRALDFVTHSMLAAPVIHDGKVLGVIEALNRHAGDSFTSEDELLISLTCLLTGKLLNAMVRHEEARQIDLSGEDSLHDTSPRRPTTRKKATKKTAAREQPPVSTKPSAGKKARTKKTAAGAQVSTARKTAVTRKAPITKKTSPGKKVATKKPTTAEASVARKKTAKSRTKEAGARANVIATTIDDGQPGETLSGHSSATNSKEKS